MKITLLVVGRTVDNNIIAGIKDYTQRVGHFVQFDMEVIPELKNTKSLSAEQQKEKEVEIEKTKEPELTDEEIDTVFDEYYLPYRDRGIIGYVWKDYEEVGREYMDACYNVPDFLENYVDYESFGEDLVNEAERYIELESGWIVEVNY